MRFPVVLVALTLSVTLACGSDASAPPPAETVTATPSQSASERETTSPAPTATATATATVATGAATAGVEGKHAPMRGIAGLIPPNFPDSTEEDWLTFIQALPSLGGVIGNYSQLTDLDRNQQVGVAAGLQVLPVTSFHSDSDGGLEATVDFRDAAQRAAFLETLVAFVEEYRPPYLGVGNEVNRIWEEDPEAFGAWVEALPEIVDAVHGASPTTQVFATFQYEFLRGLDTITGGVRDEDWTPFETAEPLLDLVAFTSYPYFEFDSPDQVPEDYYRPAVEHTSKPIGFTELGWPSAPIDPLVGSPFEGLGGTPAEQARFIDRLPDLLREVSPAFAMWVWAYDTPAVGPTFDSLGLHERDGAPKPALEAWQEFVAG